MFADLVVKTPQIFSNSIPTTLFFRAGIPIEPEGELEIQGRGDISRVIAHRGGLRADGMCVSEYVGNKEREKC